MKAISPNNKRVPSGRVTNTILAKSYASYAWPFARNNISPLSERIAPPGISIDERRTAATSSVKVKLYSCNFASDISIEIS